MPHRLLLHRTPQGGFQPIRVAISCAARSGTTEIIVRRRLALAKVSPKLLDLFREEKMTFEQLSALTVSDDHERQEQVWNGLSTWDRQAHRIKSNLLTDEVASTDRRVKFVGGLDAYEQAGGTIRRDLFDADGGGYALDAVMGGRFGDCSQIGGCPSE